MYFSKLIRGSTSHEAIVEIVVLLWGLLALTSMKGTIFHLAFNTRMKGDLQFLWPCCLALMINGAHAGNRNEDFQSWTYADPSNWEIHFIVKTAAIALVLGLLILRGAYVVRRMFNYWSPVQEPNEGPNEEQVEEPAAEAEPALPLYPFVEGNDFDAVMARAPVPGRRNSPLGWL
ncbi:hypothetical protein KC19_12G097500 [Ceratodon purpureus]|uniref:Uncharacterized protein n=2 Tax=Ceratodon purpureus TaxID=3225 RepID=A0A8T0GB66_CERPU|nr:hypothetical protein KC19_12G097500 [Ceratodon purpureus]